MYALWYFSLFHNTALYVQSSYQGFRHINRHVHGICQQQFAKYSIVILDQQKYVHSEYMIRGTATYYLRQVVIYLYSMLYTYTVCLTLI